MTEEILGFLQNNVVEYTRKTSLSKLSFVKIGGVADTVVYPESEQKLISLIEVLTKNNIAYIILGRMSNVLPAKEHYSDVIIRTDRMDEFRLEGNNLIASAGISLPRLSKILAGASLSGFEALSGIPGSLGGAIRGNAGAYGREISELLTLIRVYDPNKMETYDIRPSELDFGYRKSSVGYRGLIVLSAHIRGVHSDFDKICSSMRSIASKRRSSQPVDKPSLGSVFKRPGEDIYPWKLISDAGLRGYRLGDAQISEKHSGFIVNLGKATARDYLSVVERAEKLVSEKYGINLEREFELM